MHKGILLLMLFILLVQPGKAQDLSSDDYKNDSLWFENQCDLIYEYTYTNLDTASVAIDATLETLENKFTQAVGSKYLKLYKEMQSVLLSIKGLVFTWQGDFENGLLWAYKAKENTGKKITIHNNEVYTNLGLIYNTIGHLDSALFYCQQSAAFFEAIGDEPNYGLALGEIAGILHQQGMITRALTLHQKELEIMERIGDTLGMGQAIYAIGNVYLLQEDVMKARSYFEQALPLFEAIQHIEGIASVYYAVGNTYEKEGKLERAKDFLYKSMEKCQEMGDEMRVMALLVYIAEIDCGLKRYKESLSTFESVLPFFRQLGISKELADALIGIGVAEMGLKNLKQAERYEKEALEIAQVLGNFDLMRTAAYRLAEIYEHLGTYKDAYEMQGLSIAMKDSLIDRAKDKEIIQLEESYKYQVQFAKDSIQNAELQKVKDAELAVQEQRVNFLIIGLLLVLGLGGFAFNRYQVTKRQKKIIDEAYEDIQKKNDEKEVLLKEIHHRVKNNLQIISSLLDLQGRSIDDVATATAITDGQNRVKSMALIHQKLYQNENIAAINFKDYVEQLLNQLLTMYNIESVDKVINISADTIFDIDTAIPLGLILNELFTNSCKYAFSNDRTNRMEIALSSDAKGSYQLDIKDNGGGMPEGFDIWEAESLGLRLVGRLSEQLFGDVTYQTNEGAHFSIEFKDTELRKTMD